MTRDLEIANCVKCANGEAVVSAGKGTKGGREQQLSAVSGASNKNMGTGSRELDGLKVESGL